MRTETTYTAFDGTKFNDVSKCRTYEAENFHRQLSPNCAIFDSDGIRIFSEDFYYHSDRAYIIYAPTYNDAKIIHEIYVNNSSSSPWEEEDISPGLYCYTDNWINLSKLLKPFSKNM